MKSELGHLRNLNAFPSPRALITQVLSQFNATDNARRFWPTARRGEKPIRLLLEDARAIPDPRNHPLILTAGYDTIGNALSYFLLELARNQDVQEKLRAEVDEA